MKRIRLASIVFAVAALAALALAASASATPVYNYSFSFGSAGSGDGQFSSPRATAVDSKSNVWVADFTNDRIQEFNAEGKFLGKFGTSGTGKLDGPSDLAVDASDNVWVTDTFHHRIVKFNSKGEYQTHFIDRGNVVNESWYPWGVAIDSKGNIWSASSGDTYPLQKYNSKGEAIGLYSGSGSAEGKFLLAWGIGIDSEDNVWVSDFEYDRVQEFNSSGVFLTALYQDKLGNKLFDSPAGVVTDSAKTVWIVDMGTNRVLAYNAKGELQRQFGSYGTGAGQLAFPMGIAIDSNDNFWVADTSNNRIERWIGNTPPETTITGGSAGKVTPDVTFMFSSNEGGATFECALDAGAYSACSSPKTYEVLAEGSHTFKVRAVKGGLVDLTPAERTVEVKEVAKAVSSIAVLDDFARNEIPLANGKWTKTNWAEEIGSSWTSPWHGYGANGSHLAGAYWNGASFSDASAGLLVSATVGTGPVFAGEYMSLWLNMPSPGSARSGYEARFTGTNGTSSGYKVELSRWIAGARTVLGTKENVSLPVGTTFVLTETGSKLNVWAGTSSFSRVISAGMTNYYSGYAGIEAYKGEGTAYDFRAGNVK